MDIDTFYSDDTHKKYLYQILVLTEYTLNPNNWLIMSLFFSKDAAPRLFFPSSSNPHILPFSKSKTCQSYFELKRRSKFT